MAEKCHLWKWVLQCWTFELQKLAGGPSPGLKFQVFVQSGVFMSLLGFVYVPGECSEFTGASG